MEHELVCQACGAAHDPGGYPTGCPGWRADGRGGRLEVEYDPATISGAAVPEVGGRRAETMWGYRELLPLLADTPVTLGEGGTPAVQATRQSDRLGVDVIVKNETTNPTWSYKDRLNALLVSNRLAEGERRIATASTGNHGASTAAYASRAGIEDVIVLVPHETEVPLRRQIRAHGAEALVTEYDVRGALLAELVDRGWYPTVNVTEPYTGLPYSYEAYKTIAFELIEQAGVPDAVFVGIGAGDGLYGIWKGFRELVALDAIDEPPKMVAVQPEERTPIVEALEAGADRVGESEGPQPITLSAGGTTAGDHTLRAIRESGGSAYGIERAAIEASIRETAREGLFQEPSSAITAAGVEPALEDGLVVEGDSVVCVGTGAGAKWPGHTESAVGTAVEIEPTMEALRAAVDVSID
jgi:threonine synthase